MFYAGLYMGKCEKIFLSKTTGPRALIFGMWHHLVDLYQVCSSNTPGPKMAPPWGSKVLHRLIQGKCDKIFLSETTGPSSLIFGM